LIALVTGPPGAGKSYYAVRKAAKALQDGKIVAGNVELREDWPQYVARRDPVLWAKPWARARWLGEGERSARARFHFTEDLDELFRIRLAGSREGRGVMLLDEAHNWMNARSWSAGDRNRIVRFFSQHRKLGWDVYLIAQQAEMIDKQVRGLFEYHVHLRNLRKARFMGLPLSPVNLFLSVWTWHAATRVVVKREVYPLTWRKKLYSTTATFADLDGEDAAAASIVLPCPPADRPASTDGATRSVAAAARLPARQPDSAAEAALRLVDSTDPADLDPAA
jgi:hypothetical protein